MNYRVIKAENKVTQSRDIEISTLIYKKKMKRDAEH